MIPIKLKIVADGSKRWVKNGKEYRIKKYETNNK